MSSEYWAVQYISAKQNQIEVLQAYREIQNELETLKSAYDRVKKWSVAQSRLISQLKKERNKIMAYYYTCPDCGANLDPGEKCDCREIHEDNYAGELHQITFSELFREYDNARVTV